MSCVQSNGVNVGLLILNFRQSCAILSGFIRVCIDRFLRTAGLTVRWRVIGQTGESVQKFSP